MKNEKCPKCNLTYTHQIGCPNSGLPTYESSTIAKDESKTESLSQTSVESKKLNTNNRHAKCMNCKNLTLSSFDLAFFEAQPEKIFDSYYCGCYGWD